eukprot:COSAG01_NODE_2073_length_8494_cov_18.692555_6_plen_202_part_00
MGTRHGRIAWVAGNGNQPWATHAPTMAAPQPAPHCPAPHCAAHMCFLRPEAERRATRGCTEGQGCVGWARVLVGRTLLGCLHRAAFLRFRKSPSHSTHAAFRIALSSRRLKVAVVSSFRGTSRQWWGPRVGLAAWWSVTPPGPRPRREYVRPLAMSRCPVRAVQGGIGLWCAWRLVVRSTISSPSTRAQWPWPPPNSHVRV